MTKILIVDDEEKNSYLLQTLLSATGYDLVTAKNGAEALNLIYRTKPDVIISDILMPVMDGFTFCRFCKKDEALRDIPFIFYTATYTDAKDETLALSLGAERFIVKPTEPVQFLAILKDTLEKYSTQNKPAQHAIIEDAAYFQEYSASLIRKLEDKVKQLEENNRKLQANLEVQRRTEDRLRESEQQFIHAFVYAPIGKAVIDLDGHILKVNRAYAEILGYTEDELEDLTYQAITYPDDLALQLDNNRQCLEGKIDRYQMEKRYICKSKQVIWGLTNLSLVRNQDGQPLYFIAQVQDITQHKLSEEKIRQQTARAEALLHTASNINSTLDLKDVLDAVCGETAKALNVSVVILNAFEKDNQTLSIVADYGMPEALRRKCINIPIRDFPPEMELFSEKPIVIDDIRKVSGLPNLDVFQTLHLCSYVSVTIKNKDKIIGSLAILSKDKNRVFSEEEIILLQGLGNQAANAITNANLFENTQRQLSHIEALHRIDTAIANSSDVRMALEVVIDEVVKQMGVDAADILLYNPTSNLLELSVCRGFRRATAQNFKLGIQEGLAGQVASEQRSIFIPDVISYQQQCSSRVIFVDTFVSYYGVPLRVKGQFIGVLEVVNRTRLHPDQDWFSFMETLAGQAAITIDNIRSFEEIQISNTKLMLAYDSTIEGWSRAMDLRDNETEGHTQRVMQMTVQLARKLGISEDQIIHLRRGALLHDMGKLGIPDQILHKPDKLTAEEWVIMQKHPQYAFEMLSSINYLFPALDIPYCHHEKWDGSGYPRRLKGEEIPLAARVFAVVDVWDALTSDRPYRKAWSQEQAMEYIRSQVGVHFDPQVAETFLASMGCR